MSEQVIKRDEYKVGMKVRLASGDNDEIKQVDRDCEAALLKDANWWVGSRDDTDHGGNPDMLIIGEVVANTAAPEVATPKRADYITYEKRVYSDDMFVANGMVDCMSMAELVEQRRYYDRAISRLKATAKHYGWEV